MADTTALKNRIRAAIKDNNNQEITGPVLQQALLDIVDELNSGTETEADARQNGDTTLQQNIDAEATTRGNADTALGDRIDAEAQTRSQADTALGGRIDGVVSSIEAINNAISNGYVYAGIATPSSTPTTGRVFYLALTTGTYTHFGNIAITQGINILKYNGSAWSLDAFVGIDDTPTPSSNKLVKSGGVASALKPLQTATDGLIENENYYVEEDVQAESIGTYNGYINDDGSLTAYAADTQTIFIFGENDVKYTFNINNTVGRTRKYAIYSATRIEDCNSSTLYGSVQSYSHNTDFTVTAIPGKLLLVGGATYNKKEKTILAKRWKINNVLNSIGTKPVDELTDNLWGAMSERAKEFFITDTEPQDIPTIDIKVGVWLNSNGSFGTGGGSDSYSCKIYKLNKGTYKFFVNTNLNKLYALYIADSIENISEQTIIGSTHTFTSKQWETINVIYDNVYLVIGGGLFVPCVESISMQEDIRENNSQQIAKLTEECQNNESLINGHIITRLFSSRDKDNGPVYKAYVNEGDWIVASYYATIQLYDNNDTLVGTVSMSSKPAFGAKALRNDGTWKYATANMWTIPESYSFARNRIPYVVKDSTLFLGDSWVHITNNIHEISWVLKTAAWGQGVAGANAELVVGMFCGLGIYADRYDSTYKTAWENGYFTRTMIFLGANLINADLQDDAQKCDGNIPNNVVGNLADLLAGNTITVDGNTINTVADYYALFATNTIGQYAFLLEYLQALQPKKHIYMCGYIPWGQGTTQYGKEQVMINILTDLSKYYGVKFLNTFENSGISIRNSGVFTDDGVHLNLEGAFMYSQRLFENYNIF